MTSLARFALLTSLVASACGGVAIEGFSTDDAGSGGGANGGAGATPGSGSSTATGGTVGAGGKAGIGTGGKLSGTGGKVSRGNGGTVGSGSGPSYGGKASSGGAIGVGGIGVAGAAGAGCCLAYPTCSPGDVQVVGGPCPPDGSCYTVTACCTTIWCRQTSGCIPTMMPCKTGYKETTGPCPSGSSCYQTLNCNALVTCVAPPVYDAGTVDPGCGGGPPRGVRYISTSPEKCKLIDYACPAGTTGYADGCGCGCRQPDACPDYVNCGPSVPPGPQNPYCADTSKCPYSIRAY
jgi:hypothetical protein